MNMVKVGDGLWVNMGGVTVTCVDSSGGGSVIYYVIGGEEQSVESSFRADEVARIFNEVEKGDEK